MSADDEQRLRVLQLRADGKSLRDIEGATGVNRGTASRWIRRDFDAYIAAREVDAGDGMGELGELIAGLDADVMERARAVVMRKMASLLGAVAFADDTISVRERLSAAERLQSWLERELTVEDQLPPLPAVPPRAPAAFPCGACVECVDCAGARWATWEARVVWARRLPMATDRSAVRAGGALVDEAKVAAWLAAGADDIEAGRSSPAATFAARFANAAGDAAALLLAEHGEAVSRGDAKGAQALQRMLAALMPDAYGKDNRPLSSMARENPTARALRLAQDRAYRNRESKK